MQCCKASSIICAQRRQDTTCAIVFWFRRIAFSCVQHFDRHLFQRAGSHGILFDDHVHDIAHPFCGLFVSPFEISCFDSFEAHRFPFFEPGEFKSLFLLVIVLLILRDHIVFFLLRISIFHLQQNRIDSRVFRRCPCRRFLSSFLPEYRSS